MANDVIALIQARGGSKGVPGKNLRKLGGHPLVAWSVIACKLTQSINRVIISTDDQEIADIAKYYGSEVPFMRPIEYATDSATDFVVLKHALQWLEKNECYLPEFMVQIRPTSPLRSPQLMDKAINLIKSKKEATGLRSVFELAESPWKMFEMDDNGYLQGLRPDDNRPEYYNLPRQSFPPVFNANGYIDIVRPHTILTDNLTYGNRMISFLVPDTGEVDVEEDFKQLEYYLNDYGQEVFNYLNEHY